MLAAAGMTVMISDYFQYYQLAAYLAQFTKMKIAIVMGAASLRDIFDRKYYMELEGGILESFGRLFKHDLRLYIYPFMDSDTGGLTTVENLNVSPDLHKLYGYLVDNGSIRALESYTREHLSMFSIDALKKIQASDRTWESMVPAEVARVIKEQRFLGYRPDAPALHAADGGVRAHRGSPTLRAITGLRFGVPRWTASGRSGVQPVVGSSACVRASSVSTPSSCPSDPSWGPSVAGRSSTG